MFKESSDQRNRKTGKIGGIKMEEKKEGISTMQGLSKYCLNNNKQAVFHSGRFCGLEYQGDWI